MPNKELEDSKTEEVTITDEEFQNSLDTVTQNRISKQLKEEGVLLKKEAESLKSYALKLSELQKRVQIAGEKAKREDLMSRLDVLSKVADTVIRSGYADRFEDMRADIMLKILEVSSDLLEQEFPSVKKDSK